MSELGMVGDLRPGDFFYMFDAGLEGGDYGFCVWSLPCEVRLNVGGGIDVDGREIGYLVGGCLRKGRFRNAQETTVL